MLSPSCPSGGDQSAVEYVSSGASASTKGLNGAVRATARLTGDGDEAQCSPAPGNGVIGPRSGTCASTHLSKVAVSGAVPALGMKAVGSDAGSLSITVNRVSIVVPCLR